MGKQGKGEPLPLCDCRLGPGSSASSSQAFSAFRRPTRPARLPQVSSALLTTGDSFNQMAALSADAAAELGNNGTLGKALSSATKSLGNLTELPALAIKAFGQLAAAAGPSFEKLTAKGASVGESISEKLSKAFQSGALQKAIEQAITVIGQLGHVVANVGRGSVSVCMS